MPRAPVANKSSGSRRFDVSNGWLGAHQRVDLGFPHPMLLRDHSGLDRSTAEGTPFSIHLWQLRSRPRRSRGAVGNQSAADGRRAANPGLLGHVQSSR